jgi:hypothetical protein
MIRRLLISLDCLLDTPLGVIRNINPKAAEAIVQNPHYWERDYDDWFKLSGGLVSNEHFKEAYAARGGANTADTINASFETGIAPVLYRMLMEADINAMDGMTDVGDEIGLAINVYPFEFPPGVKLELIAIMQEKYGRELNIKIVSHSMEELTNDLLAEHYGGYLIRDFYEWFKYHHEKILTTAMSDFNVIYPKLFEIDPEELSMTDRHRDLKRFRTLTQYCMDFNFIDARYMSIVNPNSNAKADDRVYYNAEQLDEIKPAP